MRYYEVHFPSKAEPFVTTSVRGAVSLPAGTRVHAIITASDGSLIDTWELPVIDGKVVFEKDSGQIRSPNIYRSAKRPGFADRKDE